MLYRLSFGLMSPFLSARRAIFSLGMIRWSVVVTHCSGYALPLQVESCIRFVGTHLVLKRQVLRTIELNFQLGS
jgi:hypothetical protein